MASSSVNSIATARLKQAHDVASKLPRLYNVVLLNDNHTPMGFVTDILKRLFAHNEHAATQIMLATHSKGRGIAGTYPRDIADAKAVQVTSAAHLRSHPLRCVIEPELQ